MKPLFHLCPYCGLRYEATAGELVALHMVPNAAHGGPCPCPGVGQLPANPLLIPVTGNGKPNPYFKESE